MTRSDIKCDLVDEFCQYIDDFEVIKVMCIQYVFSVLYRPPYGIILKFLAFLNNFLGWVNDNSFKLVLGGDVKINVLNEPSSQCELTTLLDSNACINAVTSPTRVTETSATLIDAFITIMDAERLQSSVIGAEVTDTLPIFLLFDGSIKTTPKKLQK